MTQIKMAVSKTVNGKREEVGKQELYAPTLAEVIAAIQNAEPTGQDEQTGELVYEGRVEQFVYSALVAQVKANARNKFVPGTTDLRPNAKLPENLEELVAPTVSNKGQALAERRALIEMFKEFTASLAKPDAIKAALVMLFDKPDNLVLQDADKRAKIKPYFEDFGNSVAERLTDWQTNYIESVLNQCDAEEVNW